MLCLLLFLMVVLMSPLSPFPAKQPAIQIFGGQPAGALPKEEFRVNMRQGSTTLHIPKEM